MNRRETSDAWRTRKSQVDVRGEFPGRVMAAVRRRRTTRAERLVSVLRSVAAHPGARSAALIAGTLLGLVRIIATLHLILFA